MLLFWLDVLLTQIAGNAVKKASDNLVRAAQKAAFDKADEDNVVVKTKFVGGIAQVGLLSRIRTKHLVFYQLAPVYYHSACDRTWNAMFIEI